jgi:dipeptidyl aminopeptidase/acylaminoacyl peptidase
MNPDRYLETLLSVPALHNPKVSPDGRWVAWSWSRLGPAADVFAAPTDGSEPPIRLTETSDDTLVVSWTPDSSAVIVGQDHDGDERTQLFQVGLDEPGMMEPLTEQSPNFYVHGGQLHPNGSWLIYGANLDPESGEEIETTLVYRHDLATGERLVLARPRKSNNYAPELNASGDLVLYHRSDLHPAGLQVWLVDIEGREDRGILNFGPEKKVLASWFPDGQRILFLAEADDRRRLGIWSLEDESIRWLVDDPDADPEYAFVPPTGGPVVVVETERARVNAKLVDSESGVGTHPPDIVGNLIPLAPVGGGWVGLRYDARHPVDLIRFSEDGNATSITGLPERIPFDLDDLTAAEDFIWRSVDGLEIQGWLYRTPVRRAGTVVLVHGGPTHHAEDRFNAEIHYLVSRGFDVLTPNYRGSTGFGLAFQESIKEYGWGGREQEDIRFGIEALIERGMAEPGKVGVTGTSYGGYSAWWAITHWPTQTVAAAAPICGMTDLIVDYHSTRPDLRPYSEEMMGGSPQEIPERYRERSPIHAVDNIRGKLLVVQGLQDPNVTPENVHAIVAELERHRVTYELLTFEDEGHGIARPENLRMLYPRLADFFEQAFL